MARKVFISILGTNSYVEAHYYFDNKPKGNEKLTHFVQEATMSHLCKEWQKTDAAYIFVTKEAKKKNWNNPAQKENKNGEYIGLSKVIEDLRFEFKTEAIEIPEGFSEDEIWQIFDIVFGKLKEDDELYFDITHSFRSIPMLVMVLINYAKFLKNINVKKIYYGAFEKLGASYEVRGMPIEKRYAPILDITSFSELQDWTSAANDFVNFGNVNKLSKLAKNDISPLARQFKGKNETVKSLMKISKFLPVFINNILTCRGKNIIKNTEGVLINNELKNIKENLISPLTPILNKVENKLFPFDKNDNLINGFNAVSWCIDNNLIQQGFTILQENIISLVCEEVKIGKDEKKNRNIVSSCFAIKKNEIEKEKWEGDAAKFPEVTELILENSIIIEILKSDYINLTNIRNDINHFGYSDNAIKPDGLKKLLNDYHCEIIKKLNLSIE